MARKNKRTSKRKNKQIIKRTYKDSLFRILFNTPEHLLELYNAINGTYYEDPEVLEINTLENAMFLSVRNDVSMILDTTLSLYEHQSTYSPNLPYRNLQYVTSIYAGMISQDRVFGSHPLSLPSPSFIVFYNGTDKDLPDRSELRLSDLFEKSNTNSGIEPWMELRTIVLNINKGHNEQLMKTCQTLRDYTELVSRIRSYQRELPLEEAVTQAVDDCIKDGVLAEFLSKNRREAIRVSILECDVDKVMDYLKKEAKEDGHAEGLAAGRAEGLATGRAEGLAIGRAEGWAEGQIESYLSSIQAIMKNLNMTPIQAMDTLNIPAEERENLLKQLND